MLQIFRFLHGVMQTQTLSGVMLQVLDAVSGALIGSFTWLNLGFVAPTLTYVYRRRLPVWLRTDILCKPPFLFVAEVVQSVFSEHVVD